MHLVKPKSPPDSDWTMQKWGFNEDGQTTCECGDEQTMKHLLVCPILPHPCTHEYMEQFNPRAGSCAQYWAGVVCSDSRRRRRLTFVILLPREYILYWVASIRTHCSSSKGRCSVVEVFVLGNVLVHIL